MNHPTIEEIDFILVPNDDLEKDPNYKYYS